MRTRLVHALPATALLTVSLAAPAAAAVINGTSGNDVLVGTMKADTIRGFQGNDTIRGKGGADTLNGGQGADTIYGGRGADRIRGGTDVKKDVLYGGPGNDRIVIRKNDRVYAGPGNDVIVRPDYSGMYPLYVWCGPGYDKVLANAWLIAGGKDCEEWE